MAKPHLKLVEEPGPGRCGAPTKSGKPCRNRADGGRCSLHRDETGLPAAPAHLGEEGRECWNHHLRDLQAAGVLDRVDLTVIEKAAECYEAGKIAWKSVQKFGSIVRGRGKEIKKNPAVSKHLEYAREYRQYAKEIARIKAGANPEPDPEGLAEWL